MECVTFVTEFVWVWFWYPVSFPKSRSSLFDEILQEETADVRVPFSGPIWIKGVQRKPLPALAVFQVPIKLSSPEAKSPYPVYDEFLYPKFYSLSCNLWLQVGVLTTLINQNQTTETAVVNNIINVQKLLDAYHPECTNSGCFSRMRGVHRPPEPWATSHLTWES